MRSVRSPYFYVSKGAEDNHINCDKTIRLTVNHERFDGETRNAGARNFSSLKKIDWRVIRKLVDRFTVHRRTTSSLLVLSEIENATRRSVLVLPPTRRRTRYERKAQAAEQVWTIAMPLLAPCQEDPFALPSKLNLFVSCRAAVLLMDVW